VAKVTEGGVGDQYNCYSFVIIVWVAKKKYKIKLVPTSTTNVALMAMEAYTSNGQILAGDGGVSQRRMST